MEFPNYPNENDLTFGVKNSSESNEVMNFCILHIKFYIYKQRLFNENNMNIRELCNSISYKLEIEKKLCDKDAKFNKYMHLYNLLK